MPELAARLDQARRSMVEKKVNADLSKGELAIGLEKRGIARDSLVQQIGCLL